MFRHMPVSAMIGLTLTGLYFLAAIFAPLIAPYGMAQVVGALNLAAGLRDAWLAHSPIIAMTGGRDPRTKFRGVYQEVDDVPAFESVTKLNATVDAVEQATGVRPALPAHLADLFDRPEKFDSLPNDLDTVRRYIDANGR